MGGTVWSSRRLPLSRPCLQHNFRDTQPQSLNDSTQSISRKHNYGDTCFLDPSLFEQIDRLASAVTSRMRPPSSSCFRVVSHGVPYSLIPDANLPLHRCADVDQYQKIVDHIRSEDTRSSVRPFAGGMQSLWYGVWGVST